MQFGDPWDPTQRRFAAVLYQTLSERGEWPVFSYLEHLLGVGEARRIFFSFPVVGQVSLQPYYCDVLAVDRLSGLRAESRIALSVSGLWRLKGDAGPAGAFARLLSAAGQHRKGATISPVEVTQVQLNSATFAEEVAPNATPELQRLMGELIRSEPFAVTGLSIHVGPNPDGGWIANVAPAALRFADNPLSGDEYIAEVVSTLTPPVAEQPRALPSPLGLLTALDYLDLTWQRHCRRPLLERSFALESVARLAWGVGNQEELAGRLSTLGDVFKTLQTHSGPGASGHGLIKLRAYLLAQLTDDDDQDRVNEVLDELWRVCEVRNGLQHGAAVRKGHEAWLALGLAYPPVDWNATWHDVRAVATEAVMDLRTIVAKLSPGGCSEHP